MFSTDEKLSYVDRLSVAKDIVCNIKDEMKQLAERSKQSNDEVGMLKAMFIGQKACDAAIEIGKLQISIMQIEKELLEHINKTED